MKAPLLDTAGSEVGKVDLPDALFGQDWHPVLVSQAYRMQVANGKPHAGSTKTRAQVKGTGRKMFRQKGTGRARAGSRRAGQRVGGGAIHGPVRRRTRLTMPKKARRQALFSALSRKFSDGEMVFVKLPDFDAPSAKAGRAALAAHRGDGKALVLHTRGDSEAGKSMANLVGVHVLPGERLNIGDLLRFPVVIVTPEGLDAIKETWA